ncbi:hypothetical protein RF55_10448 [Lasius niger]|uniref:Glycoprotein n=1 Tax=Lasius niger TaxID=67767 RepID=A0A0J7NB82_LASNI|nr:hypothetical protein RF55_10448 [Lasius niger]
MLIYFSTLIFVSPICALIGFDCGGQHLNITFVSLLDVGECNLNYRKPNISNVCVQLLQLSDYNHAKAIQCKVEISRSIYYCGMHSHVSVDHNGKADYIHETGYTLCLRKFQDKTFSLGAGNVIHGLKANQTSFHSLTLAGRISNDGSCKGTQYSDPYGTLDEVVIQAVVKISLRTSHAPVQLNSGKIILKSGTVCVLSESFCLDSDDGYTYWKPIPTSSCNFHQYDVFYEGSATKITDDSINPSAPVIYSLTTQDATFALTKTKEQPLCGYTLLRTEHPKLFILETKKGDTFANRGIILVDNLDIFAGIYSEQDIQKLRDHIMFPAEKPALLNTIARGLSGHPIDTDAVSVYNLLDEASLNKITENAVSRIWNGFVTFGSATAGLFGILIIVRIVKIIIDASIHGYALHSAYGWSMHLLGAIWSSLTHLLLHLARGPVNRNNDDEGYDSSPPNAKEESSAPSTESPATDDFSKTNENARSNIEPATIEIIPYINRYQILRDIEQITTKTS